MGLVLSACGGSTGNLDQSEKQNNEGGINTTSPAKVYNEILGNDNDEILFGSTGNDHIIAGSGNDQIYSGEGNDWLEGGKGNDLFYLSVGFHDIDGGDDVDTIVVDQGSTVDFLNLDLDSSTFHFSNSIPTKVGSITSIENVEVSKNICRAYLTKSVSYASKDLMSPTSATRPDSFHKYMHVFDAP